MKFKHKLYIFIFLIIIFCVGAYMVSPKTVSWVFSYKKECKILRVESFVKGTLIANFQQANKFSIICADDGFICRAEDTAFAGVKPGDEIVFRGFPELESLAEFGKCDHAQLIKFKTEVPKGK